jgi:hypothetical protein
VIKHGPIIMNHALNDSAWSGNIQHPKTKICKSHGSAGKVTLLLFSDCNVPVLECCLEQGLLLLLYCTLKSKLKPAIRNKHRRLMSKRFPLFNKNVRPHSVAASVQAIRPLKSNLLPHPSHRLHLAPLDYHMFGLQQQDFHFHI